MKKLTLKSWVLLSTLIISQLHTLFWGSEVRVDWYLLIDKTRRIDFAVMYLTTSINFLIISYMMLFPKGISVDVKTLFFIVCLLDILHVLLIGRFHFGYSKVGLAIFIFSIVYYIKINR
tara:strand:+ start:385 stop:741 length:357 start_codon:yes stop_codon:yes gene_type:complete